MQVTVDVLEGLSRQLNIKLSAVEFDKMYAKKIADIQKTLKLDGFRQGRVPLKVVEGRFGKQITQEVSGDLINEYLHKALQEQKQLPANQPKLKEMPEHIVGKPFEFSVTYDVFPEFEVVVPIKKELETLSATITDDDVTQAIETMREQYANWVLVDRPAKTGDKIMIDFIGKIDGEAFEGGKAENFELELGAGNMIPGFEDGLMGAGAGDATALDVTFPEEYNAKELAGKPAVFDVKIHQVLEKQPLSNDEDLLKQVQVKGGIKELNAQTKKHMERELKFLLRQQLHEKVSELLVAENSFDVPKSLVEQEAKSMVKAQMAQYLGPDALKNFDSLNLPFDGFLEPAKKRVQLALIMQKLIEKFTIEADAADVRKQVEEMAEAYDDPSAFITHYYSKPELLDNVKHHVMENQAIEKVLAELTLNEVPSTYKDVVATQHQVPAAEE